MPTPGPMNPLQIQLFTGAAAGRRARFDQSPITFGRDASNLLVVEEATISRRHGEIRFEGGMWMLINLSENGTRLNRKTITNKPMPLKSGDEVFVGSKLLFNITIEPIESVAAGDLPLGENGSGQAAEGAPAPKNKNKLWISIGGYVFAMLVLIIFLSTLNKGDKTDKDMVPQLPREQIAAMIRKLPPRESTSDLRYREALADAMRLFDRRTSSVAGLHAAHKAFQTALSYSGRDDGNFPAEDTDAQFNYRAVQQELIDKVTLAYIDACNRLDRGDNDGAYRGFDVIKNTFPEGNNPFYENVQDKQNVAVKRLGKVRIKNK